MIIGIQKQIVALKKEHDIAIFAHSYQSPEILEVADAVGDSYALAVKAAQFKQKNIVMCGVKFMAETIKILCPEKNVILPVKEATCPMAEQITPEEVIAFKQKNPVFKVVCYINTTTELKAVCDVCVTSSSAVNIIKKINEPVLFIPDKNLGNYVKSQLSGKDIILLNGCCPIHNAVTEEDVARVQKSYPGLKIAMHPEISPEVLKHADFVGSTSAIMKYASESGEDVIIGTEKSISDHLMLKYPDRNFPMLSKRLMCPNMRITNIQYVYKACAGTGGYTVNLEEDLRLKAKKCIDAMIELNKD